LDAQFVGADMRRTFKQYAHAHAIQRRVGQMRGEEQQRGRGVVRLGGSTLSVQRARVTRIQVDRFHMSRTVLALTP
jgi:hypothetical protein